MNLFKRIFHFLFDYRTIECNRKAFDAWFTWHPYLGFAVDFRVEFILPHKADPDDALDASYGLEVKFNLGLLWFGIGLNVSSDDWCDCDGADCQSEVPKEYCPVCGMESEYMIGRRCPGCLLVVELCDCVQAQPNAGASGLLLDGGAKLVGLDAVGYLVPLDTAESGQ